VVGLDGQNTLERKDGAGMLADFERREAEEEIVVGILDQQPWMSVSKPGNNRRSSAPCSLKSDVARSAR
jgi:hypothetical protein